MLDAGNNKKVIQEVDRLLKKSPNFPCAKVLKGLALIRQNKKMEADAILEDVSKEVPTDDGTIQALSICYRELEKRKWKVTINLLKKYNQGQDFFRMIWCSLQDNL